MSNSSNPNDSFLPRILAVKPDGRKVEITAESLEIVFPHGRRMVLEFPPQAWGDLTVLAESHEGTPVITVQPGGCNLLTLRADVHHHMMLVDSEASLAELDLTVQKALSPEDKALPRPRRRDIQRWAESALEQDASVTIRLVSEDEGRSLNARYRGKDYATNVLTFVYDDEQGDGTDGASLEDRLYGDLVLCVPVVVREAAEQGKSVDAHFAHLVVHGMLHLQGYDHEEHVDAELMEARERELMAALGFADPYAEPSERT